jgi:hypothetical protein
MPVIPEGKPGTGTAFTVGEGDAGARIDRFLGARLENASRRHLQVSIAGLDIGKDVVVKVKRVDLHVEAPGRVAEDAIRYDLEWHAATAASMFPSMKARLVAYALGANETQLDLTGDYEPPGGVVGNAADWLVGHRIAESSVKRFLDDVAGKLSETAA